jgi:signal recognition particle subunit SEC65
MTEDKDPTYLDNDAERREYRDKALTAVAYNRIREAEEERNYLVRYIRDPEDPTLWRRTRIRELTPAEKRKLKKQPKRKLL